MTQCVPFAAILGLAACGDDHPTAPDALCEMFGDCATARETLPARIPRSHCAYNARYDHDANGLTCEPGRDHPVP
ncbi:MAG: hypothetical protein OXH69_00275 [Acidobacteria bacterium]|nr:hypothetical protein [Acidobacteriota bacterium]